MHQVRETKILEYVIILQSFFRMLKDYQVFRNYKRAIARLQGFCKSWEIRRAYVEVRPIRSPGRASPLSLSLSLSL